MKQLKITQRQEDILRLLHEHHTASQIATILKISKSAVHKYIRNLEEIHLLKENLPRSKIKTYTLTLLAYRIVNHFSRGGDQVNSQVHYNGLHLISYRYDTLALPRTLGFDYIIPMKHWDQGVVNFPKFQMRINPKCIELWWDERQAKDSQVAEECAKMRSQVFKLHLESIGFVFDGEPNRNRQWKHSIQNDPFLRKLGPGFLEGEKFIKDDTPEPNTLHLKTAKEVDDYLETPEKIDEMRKEITDLKQLFDQVIVSNTEVVKSIQDLIKSFTKPEDSLTTKEPDESNQMYG